MDIDEQLSITMIQYGRFADPSMFNDIREALRDFQSRFANTKPPIHLPSYHDYDSFRSGSANILLESRHFGPELLSGMDLARVTKTIHQLFFNYNYHPREIILEINKNGIYLHRLLFSFDSDRNPWPQYLPWTWNLVDFAIEFYLYGRDFGPSKSFDDRFSVALGKIQREMEFQPDTETQPPRKPSYSSDMVKLDIEHPPDAARVLLSATSMGSVLSDIRARLIGNRYGRVYGPREFGAYVKDKNGRKLAKVLLTVNDHEEWGNQE